MRIESTETLGGTSVTPEQQERMQQLRSEQGGAANPWASRGSTR